MTSLSNSLKTINDSTSIDLHHSLMQLEAFPMRNRNTSNSYHFIPKVAGSSKQLSVINLVSTFDSTGGTNVGQRMVRILSAAKSKSNIKFVTALHCDRFDELSKKIFLVPASIGGILLTFPLNWRKFAGQCYSEIENLTSYCTCHFHVPHRPLVFMTQRFVQKDKCAGVLAIR
ncbi:hypothetical protein DICVIV_03384 [Dictyocaulus viviparus]|uniref:Uncharacterized protein n=1 Tax=Dictyocaulus viviparus TaxID=29172 RepID=A0A0D8Y361_DICVI|nr:hypothetical protein DICVIV_03384 [Dictyocaulus viviparus]